VPDRQDTGRILDHLMSDKLQKQSKLQPGCAEPSQLLSGLQLEAEIFG
jgi:hypothetical protein